LVRQDQSDRDVALLLGFQDRVFDFAREASERPWVEGTRDVLFACVCVSCATELGVEPIFRLRVKAAQVQGCNVFLFTPPFHRDIKVTVADFSPLCNLTVMVPRPPGVC
jgi:hypothetical protein